MTSFVLVDKYCQIQTCIQSTKDNTHKKCYNVKNIVTFELIFDQFKSMFPFFVIHPDLNENIMHVNWYRKHHFIWVFDYVHYVCCIKFQFIQSILNRWFDRDTDDEKRFWCDTSDIETN